MEWKHALQAVVERIGTLAEQDPEFRNALTELARATIQIAEKTALDAIASAPPLISHAPAATVSTTAPPRDVASMELRRALAESWAERRHTSDSGESRAHTWGSRGDWSHADDSELPTIEQRCRLKAEGARWAVERQQRLNTHRDYDTEVAPIDRELIERARSMPECYLWMNHRYMPHPGNIQFYDDIGGCFEALTSALALVQRLLPERETEKEAFELSLNLAAEAQSSVRSAVARALGDFDDTDQFKVFRWLRGAAQREQIFIQRYMRADDRADPTNWADLKVRIAEVAAQFDKEKQDAGERKRLINKARYILKQLTEGKGNADEYWRKLIATFDELVTTQGVPPSNVSIRNLLLPVLDNLPDLEDAPPSFSLILREIDAFLATRERDTPDEEPLRGLSPEVEEAARLMEGRTIALIGGDRRPHSEDALIRALRLDDLVWIETVAHQSLAPIESIVARPEITLVLLAIRWSSHAFGEVKEFCDRLGKPLVRLPAGYNPNQVAHHVLDQCSDRLAVR